jgi:hypothetical protein
MRAVRNVIRYFLIALAATAGGLLLLASFALSREAEVFDQAVECPDAKSVNCYQLFPGVIEAVSVTRTASGQQDEVTIATGGEDHQVFLEPSKSDVALVRVGAPVMVEWWNAILVTVVISGRTIPTTASPDADHSQFAYVGWILVASAATLVAVSLVNRRMATAAFALKSGPSRAALRALAAARTATPDGADSWLIKPRMQRVLIVPALIGLVVLVSVRLLLNPGLRPLALAGDALVLVPVAVRTILDLRNGRLTLDHGSIGVIEWAGHARRWSLSQVERAEVVSMRWWDLGIPSLQFVADNGSELFMLSSLEWDIQELVAACHAVGLPVYIGHRPLRSQGINWSRQASRLAVLVPSLVMLVLSLLPLSGPHG